MEGSFSLGSPASVFFSQRHLDDLQVPQGMQRVKMGPQGISRVTCSNVDLSHAALKRHYF